ncbi:hypothetical protein HYQ42_10680 [Facklamia tabacinasalis]|uniref:Uncharacterized protein n=1 Tax=Ruoffia tabacinasalis TaxID=87458 RepID=A0ABS0LP42_9LACT|nr:hypothetical protein [Ruoffia tabacinasalis]
MYYGETFEGIEELEACIRS